MIKIVITNEKGGTGKSTIAALLVEYLDHQNKKVQLIDADPIQTAQTWVNNCQSKGRQVSQKFGDYQIIDTEGTSGSAWAWINEADLVLVPLQLHYADLKVSSDWFQTLNEKIQAKIIFLPNRWQNTLEQREGARQLQKLVQVIGQGKISQPLANRAAVYGSVLNGSKSNFFEQPEVKTNEARAVIRQILEVIQLNGKK